MDVIHEGYEVGLWYCCRVILEEVHELLVDGRQLFVVGLNEDIHIIGDRNYEVIEGGPVDSI